MKGILRQISSTHNKVRTAEMVGEFNELPQLHYSFSIYGAPIDPTKDFRAITTSPVTAIKQAGMGKLFKFTTLNSVYELEVTDATQKENDYNNLD